ncbi:winged helix-turn-helix domain-containing protein [Streptomyces sp. AM8-1-1]|uniref:ArsR/SmtB family transcription factor n=1 Tax=Streptomyces sp. AM8-1-1 TaxID=3075825 RepID=UPI0028C482F4|nr:winged helix-turn-helix domain-containing protein [Streptomyces sp. AM8-1-1]WNO76814.1 winged helix-turn-helix domain-containing protein [Streptomyces sp. AM8-1-1]
MRLHFLPADLRRITLAPGPDPLTETVLAARRRYAPLHGSRSSETDGTTRPGVLHGLLGARDYLPDFLLQPEATDLPTALDLVGRISGARLAAEVAPLPATPGTARLHGELASGTPEARRALIEDLRHHHTAVLPLWPRTRAAVAADRALRAETLMRGGVDALLATLGTHWRWRPPTLHIPWRGTYDVPLCGRGLLLVPSCATDTPTLMYRPEDPAVLVYPVRLTDPPAHSADVLGPLLGRTRAAVLSALRVPATTTAVAERAGVSPSSASEHATVLRNAGLVTTTRTGVSVLHALTPLGEDLLRGEAL